MMDSRNSVRLEVTQGSQLDLAPENAEPITGLPS